MIMQNPTDSRRSYDNTDIYPRHLATAPVVSVLGSRSSVAGLAPHLSPRWTVRFPRAWDEVDSDDIVLLTNADRRGVTSARAVMGHRTVLVALIDDGAGADVVVDLLTAGADVCVRAGHPTILASHLVACRRRQIADRWSTLGAACAH